MHHNDEMNNLVLKWVMIRFNYPTPALPEQASWPLTKLVIRPGVINTKLFNKSLTFTPDRIVSIEEYSQKFTFGEYVNEHGFRINPRTPILINEKRSVVSVEFSVRRKDFEKVKYVLQSCGYKVVTMPLLP